MWLHHRDSIVSGKLRCPGIFADDIGLALPFGFRLKRIFPSRLAAVLRTARRQNGRIPVWQLQFAGNRELIYGRRSIAGREDNYGITDIL
jgi:hypothetical protein